MHNNHEVPIMVKYEANQAQTRHKEKTEKHEKILTIRIFQLHNFYFINLQYISLLMNHKIY